MSQRRVVLRAPLSGWALPLAEVPDPVFAQGMAGDGVAIDPVSAEVLAPCAGEAVFAADARHAVTIRDGALEVVVHVGVDTVKLRGEGFERLVRPGQRVEAGAPLLRVDLNRVAGRVPSLATPVIVTGGRVVERLTGRRVAAGDALMTVAVEGAAPARRDGVEARRSFRLPFEHGLHVRPAAQVAGALKPFACEVAFELRGRRANARSATAMMTLGARRHDVVEVVATGRDAEGALGALAALLEVVATAPASGVEAANRTQAGRIEATIASRGFAMGPAAGWKTSERKIAERGGSPAEERAALAAAIDRLAAHLERSVADAHGEQQALLEGHAALLADPELRHAADEEIGAGRSAGAAWRSASRAFAAELDRLDDARMRERGADLRDLEDQVLAVLAGESPGAMRKVPAGSIVLADDLLPSQVMALERQQVAGLCLARGGATSHAAILAAASGLPMLVAAGGSVLAIADGTPLVLDAERGELQVDPTSAARAAGERSLAQRKEVEATDLAAAVAPAITIDGVRIGILANLGGHDDVAAAVRQGAEGCGLLRTEFLFLDRRVAPTEDEQRAEYQRIAGALAGRPLVVRTMDVGGDKPIAYLPMPHEENPALGLRGVRASLRDPDLLRAQLRAIAAVEPAGCARVMLPMVADLDALRRVREMLLDEIRRSGCPLPQLGVMVETPSSALLAGQLASLADFLSIGTNDLSQYTLAMDRGHPELARQLDALHPAVLRLIAATVEGARLHRRSVSVCGALASDVEALPILVGLGIRELSVAPGSIPRLKRRVRALDAGECGALATRALTMESAAAVRAMLRDRETMAPMNAKEAR